jgi:type IV fimbrial biogenesis protein FimT
MMRRGLWGLLNGRSNRMRKVKVKSEGQFSARGFTIIELMIAVVLLGVLVALAMPSLSDMMRRMKIETAASSLSVAFATARSEAVKRGRDVSVCISSDGAACANSTDWAVGWVIYETAGTPIKTFDAPTGGLTMLDANSLKSVTFSPAGGTSLATAASIAVCKEGQTSKVFTVAISGRMRVASGSVCP